MPTAAAGIDAACATSRPTASRGGGDARSVTAVAEASERHSDVHAAHHLAAAGDVSDSTSASAARAGVARMGTTRKATLASAAASSTSTGHAQRAGSTSHGLASGHTTRSRGSKATQNGTAPSRRYDSHASGPSLLSADGAAARELRAALQAACTALTDSRSDAGVAGALRLLRTALSGDFSTDELLTHSKLLDTTVVPRLCAYLHTYLSSVESAAGSSPTLPSAGGATVLSAPAASRLEVEALALPQVSQDGGGREHAADASAVRTPLLHRAAGDAFWALTNIGTGDTNMTRMLLRHGAVGLATRALRLRTRRSILGHATWLLGNIAADGAGAREEIMKQGGLPLLLQLVVQELGRGGIPPYAAGPAALTPLTDTAALSEQAGGAAPAPGAAAAPLDDSDDAESVDHGHEPSMDAIAHSMVCPACMHELAQSLHGSDGCGPAPDGGVVDATAAAQRSEPRVRESAKLLRVATWALANICATPANLPQPANDLVAVLNACLDYPDAEVLANASWALSHMCDGPTEFLFAATHSLVASTPPTPFPTASVGRWELGVYAPAADAAVAAAPLPTAAPRGEPPPAVDVAARADEHAGCVSQPSTLAKLIRLMRSDAVRVCKPALRAVGNIVCAEDTHDFTQAAVRLGLVRVLTSLLDHRKSDIQKEACWTMSNVAAGTHPQIQAVLDSGCLPKVLALCSAPETEASVRTEACWVLLNATSGGTEKQIEMLVRAGVVRTLCSLMRDPSIAIMALEGLDKILQVCERLSTTASMLAARNGRSGFSPVASASAPVRPAAPTSSAVEELKPRASAPVEAATVALVATAGTLGTSTAAHASTDASSAPFTSGPPAGDDPSLEDLLFSEAKSLLHTCRTELLSRNTRDSGSSGSAASGSGSSGGGASAAKNEAMYKRTMRLWDAHFVTCQLCQRTHSRHGGTTRYCNECRCHVCMDCDCSRYHLSFQLALLEAEAPADGKGTNGSSSGGGGKKKKAGKSAKSSKPGRAAGAADERLEKGPHPLEPADAARPHAKQEPEPPTPLPHAAASAQAQSAFPAERLRPDRGAPTGALASKGGAGTPPHEAQKRRAATSQQSISPAQTPTKTSVRNDSHERGTAAGDLGGWEEVGARPLSGHRAKGRPPAGPSHGAALPAAASANAGHHQPPPRKDAATPAQVAGKASATGRSTANGTAAAVGVRSAAAPATATATAAAPPPPPTASTKPPMQVRKASPILTAAGGAAVAPAAAAAVRNAAPCSVTAVAEDNSVALDWAGPDGGTAAGSTASAALPQMRSWKEAAAGVRRGSSAGAAPSESRLMGPPLVPLTPAGGGSQAASARKLSYSSVARGATPETSGSVHSASMSPALRSLGGSAPVSPPLAGVPGGRFAGWTTPPLGAEVRAEAAPETCATGDTWLPPPSAAAAAASAAADAGSVAAGAPAAGFGFFPPGLSHGSSTAPFSSAANVLAALAQQPLGSSHAFGTQQQQQLFQSAMQPAPGAALPFPGAFGSAPPAGGGGSPPLVGAFASTPRTPASAASHQQQMAQPYQRQEQQHAGAPFPASTPWSALVEPLADGGSALAPSWAAAPGVAAAPWFAGGSTFNASSASFVPHHLAPGGSRPAQQPRSVSVSDVAAAGAQVELLAGAVPASSTLRRGHQVSFDAASFASAMTTARPVDWLATKDAATRSAMLGSVGTYAAPDEALRGDAARDVTFSVPADASTSESVPIHTAFLTGPLAFTALAAPSPGRSGGGGHTAEDDAFMAADTEDIVKSVMALTSE